jgi:hypothetical protein
MSRKSPPQQPEPATPPPESRAAAPPAGPDTSPHRLVTKVLGEEDAPEEELAILVGYFGKEDGERVRLYTSLDFRSYYHIVTDAIVHTEPTDTGNENSPTRVWVKAESTVDYIVTAQASHLQGAITTGHLASAVAAHAARLALGGRVAAAIDLTSNTPQFCPS